MSDSPTTTTDSTAETEQASPRDLSNFDFPALDRSKNQFRLLVLAPGDFDDEITREDKDILESTDPDALVDTRRRGVEYSMESDKPGMLIRKHLMQLLARHGEAEVHRGMKVVALAQAA